MLFGSTLWVAAVKPGAGPAGPALFAIFGLEVTAPIVTMWAVMALILVMMFFGTRGLNRVPDGRFQVVLELIIDGLVGLLESIFGSRKKALAYLPFLGSMFLFILASNYSGLLPGAGKLPGFMPPTAVWSVTAGLAVVVFFTVQYSGLRAHGLGYFRHFFDPWYLTPLLLPLGILEEVVRPFSLSLRLFANMFGGKTVLTALLLALPYFLPISVMALELIFGFVQAFIFTTLSAVYLANATAEHH